MKLLRTREHRRLLKMLTTARRRAALTQTELAERVSADRGFAVKYESGQRGGQNTLSSPSSLRREG